MQHAGPPSKQTTATQSTVDVCKHTLAPQHHTHRDAHKSPLQTAGGQAFSTKCYATTTQPLCGSKLPQCNDYNASKAYQMHCAAVKAAQHDTAWRHHPHSNTHMCIHTHTPTHTHVHSHPHTSTHMCIHTHTLVCVLTHGHPLISTLPSSHRGCLIIKLYLPPAAARLLCWDASSYVVGRSCGCASAGASHSLRPRRSSRHCCCCGVCCGIDLSTRLAGLCRGSWLGSCASVTSLGCASCSRTAADAYAAQHRIAHVSTSTATRMCRGI